VALSPDGRQIIVAAPNSAGIQSLWLRSIDSMDARELPGTANGILPFWSPDGKSVGFFNFGEGKLKRVDIAGGAPQVLAAAANPRGGTWSTDGTILFVPAPTSELLKVPASGGTASPLKAALNGLQTFEAPHFLPDGKHFLYYVFRSDPDKQGLYVGSLETGESKKILGITSRGEYANGYLFFCKGTDLFAQPFDLAKLELHGDASRVASNVGYNYGDVANRAFSVAAGTLAFTSLQSLTTTQLAWFDRSGKQLERIGEPGGYFGFAVSPDQKKVVLEKFDVTTGRIDLSLVDFGNGIVSRLAEANATPVWTPDSRRILYGALNGSVEVVDINSGRKEPALPASEDVIAVFLQGVSPDGRYLVWTKTISGESDLWIAALDGSEKPKRFLQTPYNEFRAQISPDGHWIAYVTNESGTDEIMVESFPQPGQRKRISPEGGEFPQWRADGRELYYFAPSSNQRRKLMAVRTETGSTFSASRPEPLFEVPPLGDNPRRGPFAPIGNGERFLMNMAVPDTKPRSITLLLNWPSLLK
jgi:Tol biopolymer transport system component